MEAKIKKFIDALPLEKRKLAVQLRDIFLNVDKKIEERIKWGNLTFVYKGNIAFVYTYKRAEYLNLGFLQAVKLKDPKKKFQGTGKGMRHVKIYSEKDINAKQIMAWVKEAMKVNEEEI